MGELIGAPGRGAGLVVDYGDDRVFGSSFRVRISNLHPSADVLTTRFWVTQAFQRHKIVDVFHQPGMCDLTANVDFAYLKEALATAGEHMVFWCPPS
jgi:NADH dehydrogenase [ubiquinone] 1 alpha subcomplex assembly factor 7